MAETALDLITNSLLDLGVLADEETPTASQAAGGLRKLNNMIDSWNIENLQVFGATESVFPLVSNDGVYTLGTGGNFNIPRPNTIQSAYIRDTSQPVAQRFDYPIYIYNQAEYADVALKQLVNPMPLGVYFDDSFPLINVYLWPVPSTTQYSLVLWTGGVIQNFALNDPIELAPGYKRALEANLCVELAPSYQVQITPATAKIAMDSKSGLKTQNFQLNEMYLDPRLGNRYFDYRTGE